MKAVMALAKTYQLSTTTLDQCFSASHSGPSYDDDFRVSSCGSDWGGFADWVGFGQPLGLKQSSGLSAARK